VKASVLLAKVTGEFAGVVVAYTVAVWAGVGEGVHAALMLGQDDVVRCVIPRRPAVVDNGAIVMLLKEGV
jgi:hypothetical protein